MLYRNGYGCFRLFQTTIKNRKAPHLKRTGLNRIQVTTLACNIQVKQRYGTMLATATENCAVTVAAVQQTQPTMRISIMSSRELFISSPRCTVPP